MMLREALFDTGASAAHEDSAHLHLEWDDEEIEAAAINGEESEAAA